MLSLSLSQFKPYFLLSKQIFMALCEWAKKCFPTTAINHAEYIHLKNVFLQYTVFSLNSKISHINEHSLEFVFRKHVP